VVQTLVVVLENGHALCLAAVVLGVCVGHVARENFLPEGEAARGACLVLSVVVMFGVVAPGASKERAWRVRREGRQIGKTSSRKRFSRLLRKSLTHGAVYAGGVWKVVCRHELWSSC